MTKVITFASSKGGAGKSTLCVNLAAFFVHSGKKVTLLDVDPQKSAYDWITESSDSLLTQVTPFHLSNESEIENIIEQTESDLVCIDLQGSLINSPIFALAIADVVLVPCRPSRDDIVGVGWILKLNELSLEKYPMSDAKVIAVLNAVNSRSVVYHHIKNQIQNDNINSLSTSVPQVVAFAEANINRVSVMNVEGKAKSTILSIGHELTQKLFT